MNSLSLVKLGEKLGEAGGSGGGWRCLVGLVGVFFSCDGFYREVRSGWV